MIYKRPEEQLWEDINRANDSEKSLMVFNLLYDDMYAKYMRLILSNKPEAVLLRDRHIAVVQALDEIKNEYEKLAQDGDTARQQLNQG